MSKLDKFVDLSRRLLVELNAKDRELARLREPIAIIGMACRFPGGRDLRDFEDLLRDGRDAIVPVPEERWARGGPEGLESDHSGPGWGGLLEGIESFDAEFFRIAPVEAAVLDPQQRLLLETSWRALENAGLDPRRLRKSQTAVFTGISTTDYRELVALSADAANRYMSTGTFASTAAGRIAYTLGLEGPTMAIDTACSSSLVALHQAVTALQREEADLALAGGVNAILSASQMAAFANAGMLAPDGRCKTFDALADGYVRGEGCGMVVLQRLEEAKLKGNRILAVIRGTAVNQDGASSGLTVPKGTAQKRVILAALARAGLDPEEVDYLEAHGTGTELGDPIEVRAASAIYGEGRALDRPLLIGSVKTNIGHLEAAAGIAGVIKTVLALRGGTIPKHLNFQTPNPRLDWSSLPVRVTAQPTPWPATAGRPRRAGISSFGFSGTNAHLLLESWDEPDDAQVTAPENLVEAPASRHQRLLPVSARTADTVPVLAHRYLSWLDRQASPVSTERLADFAWTVSTGRSQFEHRAAPAFCDEASLRKALISLASEPSPNAVSTVERVGFLFTGQGSQWPGMGRQLYESEPVFRSVLERCDEIVKAARGTSLIGAMFDGGDLDDTAWAQPALYALSCGLVSLWDSAGVRPAAVLGHSIGELAAAYAAGVLTLEDGARFAVMRGFQMSELARAPGMMAAVFAPVAKVQDVVDATDGLSLAAENGTHCVVSGPPSAMAEVGARCQSSGMRFQPLRTSHAFHNPLIEPALNAIETGLADIAMARPSIPLVSNLTGRVLKDAPDATYWCNQARGTVRFSAGVLTLSELGIDLLIECGPDAVLGRLAQSCWPGDDVPPAVASLTPDSSFCESVATVWEAGQTLSFSGLFAGEVRRRLAAPGHPFQRRRFWLDDRRRRYRPGQVPGLGIRTRLANGEAVFDRAMTMSNPLWLAHHVVFELAVVPGALWAIKTLTAATVEYGTGVEFAIEEARLHAPLILADDEQRTVQTVLAAADPKGRRKLEIYSQTEDSADWVLHFQARLKRDSATVATNCQSPSSICATMTPADPEQHYAALAAAGMAYGSAFRRVKASWVAPGEAVVEISLNGEPEVSSEGSRALLLDGCLQALPLAAGKDDLFLPFGWNRLWLTDVLPERFWCRAEITDASDELLKADLTLLVGDGTILGAIEGFTAKRATRQRLLAAGGGIGSLLYEVSWRPSSDTPTSESARERRELQERQGNWVLVGDGGGVSGEIAAALGVCYQKTIQVDTSRDRPTEKSATVVASRREDWRAFFAKLGDELRGVLHLSGIDAGASAADTEGVARDVRTAMTSALALSQGLDDARRAPSGGLWILTRGAQAGPEGASGHPAGSVLWGFARTVGRETNWLRPRLIDLDPSKSGIPNDLVDELLRPGGETELAWRDGMRTVPRLVPLPARRHTETVRLNSEGTYLVTGGLRGLGLEVAAWLADRGARTLVLNGRTPPDDLSRTAIKALEARDVKVETEYADVADEAALAALLARIDDTLPPLAGIVHCAGVFADRAFANLDWEQCEAVLRPKVLGAWNLHRLTERQNPELFLMFSSVAGSIGNPGQANYAAANAFLDQLAAYRRSRGLAGQSIAWGPWSDIGEAARRRAQIASRLDAAGQRWITPREGRQILDQVVGGEAAMTIAAAVDWTKLFDRQNVPPFFEGVIPFAGPSSAPALLTRLRVATGNERESLIVSALQAELQAILRLPELPSAKVGFFDLGMDSLTAVELRNRLNRLLEGAHSLSSTVAFDFPDIGKLARHLVTVLEPDTDVPAAPVGRRRLKSKDRIVIVGMGCRFPGSEGLDAFRALLEEGRSAISPFPGERWPQEQAESAIDGDQAAFQGGFVDGIDQFDADFFRIAPVEAQHLDPQQRLLLETAWHALEDAGISPETLRGSRTGVLAGVMNNDYRDLLAAGPEATSAWLASGTMDSTAIGRVAFALGLEGPALAVDTACSSSLVAIHQAIAALQGGEADIMLAGGVNAVLSPVFTRSLINAGMLAADGLCKTFDARADGYGRGEGCGVVVLKRLADATADGDRIRAVISGSVVNHDGASAGLTVPNGPAQESVIASALERAGIEPSAVDYLEAHGTGTDLGDPIEVQAAAAIYGTNREKDRPLMIGSVKTNVGHLEGAAGVAGLIKIVLAMESGTIPRHLNFELPNPRIDWERLPVRVVAEPVPWPERAGQPRTAGLSSFGFSGTNAHLIVESWPMDDRVTRDDEQSVQAESSRAMRLLPLSARTEDALRDLARRHVDWLDSIDASHSEDPHGLADLAWSASMGRSQLEHRKAIVFADRSELRRGLVATARTDTASPSGTATRVAFLFTGQGSQWQGMGQALYRAEPAFRAILDRCESAFRELVGKSLLKVMFTDGDLDDTAWAQPALYTLACGLAELWSHIDVRPAAVLGHSVGEIAAARTAEVFSLEDGLRLATERGAAMSRISGKGAMAAVFGAPEKVADWVAEYAGALSVAADNGTHQVVSGEMPTLAELEKRLVRDGIHVSRLATSHAFHSAMMDPILDDIEKMAESMTTASPAIPLISNLTGRVRRDATDGAYWRRHARQPVAFAAGVRTLVELDVDAIVELGPRPVLGPLAHQIWPEHKPVTVASQHQDASLSDGGFLTAAAALWQAGMNIGFEGLFEGESRRRLPLPLYPFQRRRHWVDISTRQLPGAPISTSPGRRTDLASGEIIYEMTLSESSPGWLADHRVFDQIVAPAALWGALATEMTSAPQGGVVLEDLQILSPLVVSDGPRTLQATAGAPGDDRGRVWRVHSRGQAEEDWIPHAEGRLIAEGHIAEPAAEHHRPEADDMPVPGFYSSLARIGIGYGPAFRRLTRLHAGDDQAFGHLLAPGGASTTEMLDGCLQVLAAAAGIGGDSLYLPFAWKLLWLGGSLPAEMTCHARVHGGKGAVLTGDIDIFDEAGGKVGAIRGLTLKQASRQALFAAGTEKLLHELTWRPDRNFPSRAVEDTSGSQCKTWVVATDGSELAAALVSSLISEGQQVVLTGEAPTRAAYPPGCVDMIAMPIDTETWRQLFADLGERLRGVVWLATQEDGKAGPAAAATPTALGALAMTQGLDASGIAAPTGLTFVTQGAQILNYEHSEGLAGASLWGLGRTVQVEAGHLGLRLLDLDPAQCGTPSELMAELLTPDQETEIAWRNGVRHVARLALIPGARQSVPLDQEWHLAADPEGVLSGLRYEKVPPHAPDPGEVRIAVEAAGINFHDVLTAMRLVDVDSSLGGDLCGRVIETGAEVTEFAVGDRVMGIAAGSFASEVTTDVRLVTALPPDLPGIVAAGMPSVYLTVALAFERAALKRGDRILIHAAAGGVGHAAIALGRAMGAQMFATASAGKQEYVRRLGVPQVFDSRDPSFGASLLKATGGSGVDIVLNSLTGQGFIEASLSCLGSGGRFIELSKRDIWTEEEIAAVRPDVDYAVLAVDELAWSEPSRIGQALRSVAARLKSGELPPLPCAAWPVTEAVGAMEAMQAGRHRGKLALVMPGDIFGQKDRSWLVTGGLGGLGLEVAKWLAGRGAGSLILNGRRPPDADVEAAIAALRERGTRVEVELADVADEAAVASLMARIDMAGRPLAGIFHCAGVLADAALADQNAQRFGRVMAAKVAGAWNLHQATRHRELNRFVLFSSVAGALGNAGQANYAAANAWLDQFARYRRARGLAGQSIAWGPWADVGMAQVRRKQIADGVAAAGLGWLSLRQGLAALDRIVSLDITTSVVAEAEWSTLAGARQSAPLFEQVTTEVASDADDTPSLVPQLQAAAEAGRPELLAAFLQGEIQYVLMLPNPPPITTGFLDLGLNSLMAVEIRNRLNRALAGTYVAPSTVLFDFPDVETLTAHLLSAMGLTETSENKRISSDLARIQRRIDNLSDEEFLAETLSKLSDVH